MASFSDLPKELMEEIMSRLSPNSLRRAKCVSKSWYTLISGFMSDPEFVVRHLRNMKNNPTTSMVLGGHIGQFSLLTLFNDDVSEYHIHGVTKVFPLPLGQEDDGDLYEAFHCDGILCLVKNYRTIMLWNPAIQEIKLLPESKINAIRPGVADIGFGYDSSAKDYKVVRIGYPCYPNRGDPVRAEVYTSRTDTWREINVNLGNICPSDCATLLERSLLLGGTGPSETYLFADWSGFFVQNDSLALFLCSTVDDSSSSSESGIDDCDPLSIDICVMDECFGVEGVRGACSWTKSVYTVTPPIGIWDVFKPWKSDEFLMVDSNHQLVSYNLRTKKLRNITIPSLRESEFCACYYVKSLVSVRGL
ncbi:hypothetical protein TIFTF001_015740 [Ficus carica]|uniref:F-box domain-containing protein n=1 Tax=Ficus carica TaxID=3494 RepID=A0AA88D986_FICCA|nr:hypothetical protein TIFTF001_015740 [Ficus carica]